MTRWHRAAEAKQEYLVALARTPGAQSSAKSVAVAEQFGNKSGEASVIRAQLIEKDLLCSPVYGRKVAFTVPGMDDFVLRQNGDG